MIKHKNIKQTKNKINTHFSLYLSWIQHKHYFQTLEQSMSATNVTNKRELNTLLS